MQSSGTFSMAMCGSYCFDHCGTPTATINVIRIVAFHPNPSSSWISITAMVVLIVPPYTVPRSSGRPQTVCYEPCIHHNDHRLHHHHHHRPGVARFIRDPEEALPGEADPKAARIRRSEKERESVRERWVYQEGSSESVLASRLHSPRRSVENTVRVFVYVALVCGFVEAIVTYVMSV